MVDLFEGSGINVPPARAVLERHPSEDELELYSMGHLAEPESISLEEHLLVCATCQNRLGESDEFVALMKETTKEIARREGEALSGPTERRGVLWLRSLWYAPRPVFAAIAAMLVLAAGIGLYRGNEPPASGEVSVELAAIRGGESPSVNAASAASLRLVVDTTGLPSGRLGLELVASDGASVWSGDALSGAARLTVVVPKTLRAGHYFLRVSAESALVREMAFEVR